MKKTVTVKPEEWNLFKLAEGIERENQKIMEEVASKRTAELGHPVIIPMEFFSENEMGILNARDEMVQHYQQKNHLDEKPTIIPADCSLGGQGITPSNFYPSYSDYPYRHKGYDPPLPGDLVQEFLRMVPTFRNGERLYIWEGTHYCYFPDSEVKARINTVLANRLRVPNSTALLSNILGLLKAQEEILGTPDVLPYLVAVQNGVVDLRHLQLSPPNKEVFLTHYLDVPWQGEQPCPVFRDFLNHTSGGDPELAQRLLEIIGYLLVPDYGAKKFVVFQGEGDCGKSVLGNLISSFFRSGDYASLADYQFGDRFSMAAIANCHLCLSMDLSDGVIDSRAVSILKQITGDDPISIEAKGKDAYTGHIRCKILFGTNNPIKLKTRQQPFARRLLLMPFLYPVPEWKKDRNLLDKLKMERSGILYLALRAYCGVVAHGYHFTGEAKYGFTAEQIVLDKGPGDGVQLFADQCCVLMPDCFTPTEQLHNAYLVFCHQMGLDSISNRAAFSRALKLYFGDKIYLDKQRVGGTPLNGYHGIQLKEGGMLCV